VAQATIPRRQVGRRPEFVHSLAHGLAVLTSFSRERPTQTLSEVAAAVGVTRATARRLLLTLQDLGYVGSQGRHFFLLPAVLTVSAAYLSLRSMWEGAPAHLRALAAETRESCGAAVLDGGEAVHILRAVADDILCVNLTIGTRLPASCTAVGQVLLAELDPPALERYVARAKLPKRTERTITDPDRLRARLAAVRACGWAIDDEEWSIGIRAIAVPVRGAEGSGALDVVCLSGRASVERLRQEILPPLQRCAERIGQATLGLPA